MAHNSVHPHVSKSSESDAYWIAYYYPLLIMLFSVLCQSGIHELIKNLSQAPASASTPSQLDASKASDLPAKIPSVCSQPYSAVTTERADEEPGLRSTSNEQSTGKFESSPPSNADASPHQNALVDEGSTTALDRQIAIASVWQLLQICLIHRMGALAVRFIHETGALKGLAVVMLGVCTFFVGLSLARLDQGWDAVHGLRDTGREESSKGKAPWFKMLGNVALYSLLIPWYRLVRA
ncbi:uncharacterized protein A1O5_00423 [Cladophialophora psammophila CBS 110553]|uniref:Uncharacterized protein n=1 Tax=Cladophialophora psammophila CBS 110553 TaxID=1182543 RepID=W9XF11_9EURO|nr:uncharacterized protein A1O5_00423 [Cladophialophora psammophila CBS 110553]EXJ75915.1 hypothetical protein A1O5_00423 [Cladophialophora psammophila CBS 110553]